MAVKYDDRTQYLKLPKPNPYNDQADDCTRIARALEGLDAAIHEKAENDDLAWTAIENAQNAADSANGKAVAAQLMAHEAAAGLAGKVNKDGDTMTGGLTINGGSISVIRDQYPGISLASAVPVSNIQDSYGFIEFQDSQKKIAGRVVTYAFPDGSAYGKYNSIQLLGWMPKPDSGEYFQGGLGVNAFPDNSFSTFAITPFDWSYSEDIATTRWCKNIHPQKGVPANWYVGGANASDTADLFRGRGESPETPFASLQAVFNFICNYLSPTGMPIIHVQADLEVPSECYIHNAAFRCVQLTADSTGSKVTFTGTKGFRLLTGCLWLKNITLVQSGGGVLIAADGILSPGSPTVYVETGVVCDGSASHVFECLNTARLIVNGPALSGGITGSRYRLTNGSAIFTNGGGPTAIPGTIDGTCDASSKIF